MYTNLKKKKPGCQEIQDEIYIDWQMNLTVLTL